MSYCPRCFTELQPIEQGGQTVDLCSQCRGIFCEAGELQKLVGRPFESRLAGDGEDDDVLCPGCDATMEPRSDGASTFLSCRACGGHWLEAGVVAALRAASALPVRASRSPAPPSTGAESPAPPAAATSHKLAEPIIVSTASVDGERPLDDRVAFGSPLVDLLAYPIVGVLACIVGILGVGRTIAFLAQLWFHELGHAVFAWLSGRAALPLPVGFTFWREEPSVFTTVCVTFLIGVFAWASIREKRRIAVVFAAVLFVLQLLCTVVIDDAAMIEWILFGGLAGELLLSTTVIVAFYYPAPDRFRWDFFRFALLIPAATTFVSSLMMWIRIDRGQQGLPLGSILGAPGDGTGDIDRLMDVYGWTGKGLTDVYRLIGLVCLAVIVGHYVVFAVRAVRRRALDARDAAPSSAQAQ